MSYSQRKLAQSYLDYVSNNKSRNEYVLTLDKKDLRNFMAENGIEWTPQELNDVLEVIGTALEVLNNDNN
jgi:hypothetical protein